MKNRVCEFCGERAATTSWDCEAACVPCARTEFNYLVEDYGGDMFAAADELSTYFDDDPIILLGAVAW